MGLPNKLRERLAQQFIASLKEGQLPWKACWQKNLPENRTVLQGKHTEEPIHSCCP